MPFCGVYREESNNPVAQHSTNESYGLSLVVPFVVLRSEFDYLIQDRQHEARLLTELAFEHLRRLIVVDGDLREKWSRAFGTRENECERLGAVHLLGHGIWAFKVSAAGGSTDLVFGEPLDQHSAQVRRTARAVVATEWKLVKTQDECNKKAAQAVTQLEAYQRGVLGDLELTSIRYVVLVTNKSFQPLADVIHSDITYRHIILPTDPDSASVEARKMPTAASSG